MGGCKDSDSPTITQSLDYEFTVIFDGVSNKVKGTIENPVDYFSLASGNSNVPSNFFSSDIDLSIDDVSNSNYIEGHPFNLSLYFERDILGELRAAIYFNGHSDYYRNKYTIPDRDIHTETYLPYDAAFALISDTLGFRKARQDLSIDDVFDWREVFNRLGYFSLKVPGSNKYSELFTTEINITDLGAPSRGNPSDGKIELEETIKGYMTKTKLFYPIGIKHSFIDDEDVFEVSKWSPPIELEFSFKAIRLY